MGSERQDGVRWREERPGVMVVTLDNPPMNALSRPVSTGLARALDEVEATGARAVVVAGAGRAFSAGAEVSELPDLADPVAADAQVRRMHELFARLEALPVPTLAALDGAAVGGGLELALACDLRVAGPKARLGLPEVTLGLIPGAGGTQRLPAAIGRPRALELVLSGRLVDAVEAERVGLVHRVAAEGTALAAALDWAVDLATRPRAAVAAAKAAVRSGSYDVEREQFVAVSRTADAAEGIAAFLEHRSPRFA